MSASMQRHASEGRGPSAHHVFPRLLAPFADESLPGLLLRYSELYRYRDPRRLLTRTGADDLILWTLCQEDPDGEVGSKLGSLLGLDDPTFRRMSLHTGHQTTIRVLGIPIWRDLARHDLRAVCPACLRDSPHHRAVWLVDALPVCAIHGSWLLTRCPRGECSSRLRWNGMGVHRCDQRGCRCDLRDFAAPGVNMGRLGGVRGLHNLLHQDDDSLSPLGMPRGEALRMAFVLGQHAFGHERSTRPNGYLKRHMEMVPEILDAGWRALQDWPNGFHGFLDTLSARAATRRGKAGFQKHFGHLANRVYHWAREPWGAPLGTALANYAAGNPDLAVSRHQLRRYAPGVELRHVHVSLGEAQSLLGVGPVTMMALAEQRNLYRRRPEGSGVPALLRADAVRELADELSGFLLPREARARLGVGYRLLRQLEAAGLITQVPEAERVMETRSYRRSDIDVFLQACRGKAPRMSADAAKAAGLTPITRLAAPGRSVPDVCRALMGGRLRAVAVVTGKQGLASLRFRMEDVGRVAPAVVQTMSIVEAARRLDTDYPNLHVWARKGMLETVTSDRPGERGLRVTEEGLASFQKTYASGRDLKVMFRQKGNHWLSRHLAFQGIRPVSGRGVDEGNLTLFLRADLTPEVIRAVCDVQARPTGTGAEKHRAAFAKAGRAAEAVAAAWGARFTRTNNCFTDEAGGRTLQVVSGRRPDLTGVFRFKLNPASLHRLRERVDPWVALVPAQGEVFLLAPLAAMPWRGGGKDSAYVSIGFDANGRPVDAPKESVEIRFAPEKAG